MADKLSVDLEVKNAARATGDVQKFTASLEASTAKIEQMAGRSNALLAGNFSQTIASVERQASNLRFTLGRISDVSINTKGLDGIGRAADRARAEVDKTFRRLQAIEAEAAVAKDPVILKRLQTEAVQASAQLDRLQTKIERVAAGRAAVQSRNAASGIDGRGLLGTAAGLGVPGAFEASSALEAAAAAGISAAALASFAAIAAAGYGIIKITESIRTEAERRLKTEEGIAAAANKQIIAQREQLKNFQEQDALRQRQLTFSEQIAKNDNPESLRRQIELLTKLRGLGGAGAEGFDKERTQAEARLRELQKKGTTDADAAARERFENFKKSQQQAAEYEARKAAERAASIQKGTDKVKEFQKETNEFFANLYAKQGAANPFVALFTEAERQIEATRVATRGLSKDLQQQAADMIAAGQSNALFSARLEQRLQSLGLRSDAAGFRAGGNVFDTARADLQARQKIEQFQREASQGLFRNPAILAQFQSGTSNKAGLDLFNFRRQLDESQGLFRNPQFDAETRRRLSQAEPGGGISASERLQKQLDVIRQLNPANEAQRAEADRKIIALTQGLNPADLTDSQRNAAAAARENEATRLDNAEKDAKKERDDAAATQKSIDKNIAELLKIAQTEGFTGVIRIINDAGDSATDSLKPRPRATPEDAKASMGF